jgi:hypothetical protein
MNYPDSDFPNQVNFAGLVKFAGWGADTIARSLRAATAGRISA